MKVGMIDGIEVVVVNCEDDSPEEISYSDFNIDLKNRFKALKKELKKNQSSLTKFIAPLKKVFELTREEYFHIKKIKNSVISHRSMSDSDFFPLLLAMMDNPTLKGLCRDHKIKNYSSLKKKELIEHITINLSDEIIRELIVDLESDLISREIALSKRIILGNDQNEKIQQIQLKQKHEVEALFVSKHGKPDWSTNSYLNIKDIDRPDRICDCRIGENDGFCKHFWVLFFYLLKHGAFVLEDWNVTYIPPHVKNDEVLRTKLP